MLCLNLIVKNESRVILRCLNSARSLVDVLYVLDTGSTDNTTSIITEFCQREGLPHQIEHADFDGFGPTRTKAYQLAQAAFPGAKSFLFLDADMELILGTFQKSSLDSHPDERERSRSLSGEIHLMFEQRNQGYYYYNTRIIGRGDSQSIGLTHEYWQVSIPARLIPPSEVYIQDHDDGGSKADKLIRDQSLLQKELILLESSDPRKARVLYYLAHTYLKLEKYMDCLETLEMRLALKGTEELYNTYYLLGHTYRLMDQPILAIQAYLEAWEVEPRRAEPLRWVAFLYHNRGRPALAAHWAAQAYSLPFPRLSLGFIESDVYLFIAPAFVLWLCSSQPEYKYLCELVSSLLLRRQDLPPWLEELNHSYRTLG